MKARLLSREPWPAMGIGHYRKIDDGPWGYLSVYSDLQFVFDAQQRPSDAEILQRWRAYLENTAEDASQDVGAELQASPRLAG